MAVAASHFADLAWSRLVNEEKLIFISTRFTYQVFHPVSEHILCKKNETLLNKSFFNGRLSPHEGES